MMLPKPTQPPTPSETLADDAGITPAQQEVIQQFEPAIRTALQLFGIDYDQLIRLDGQSAYAQAVAADPSLPARVAQSANPVLAALEVAVRYQPYAEFLAKYGQTPDAIKAALWEEFKQGQANPATATPTVPAAPTSNTAFSRSSVIPPLPERTNKTNDLSAFIKR